MNKTNLIIYTDGGSRGNPGIAGAGIYVVNQDNEVVLEKPEFLGKKTNNEAEYLAFQKSAEWLVDFPKKLEKVLWKLDSKLVVEQLNKRWKIKEPRLHKLAEQCWILLESIPYPIEIIHIPRAQNKQADLLANIAMDSVKTSNHLQ